MPKSTASIVRLLVVWVFVVCGVLSTVFAMFQSDGHWNWLSLVILAGGIGSAALALVAGQRTIIARLKRSRPAVRIALRVIAFGLVCAGIVGGKLGISIAGTFAAAAMCACGYVLLIESPAHRRLTAEDLKAIASPFVRFIGAVRRRARFSLRTLLIAVAVLCVPLSWLTWDYRQYARQKEAVDLIEGIGGEVRWDREGIQPFPRVRALGLRDTNVGKSQADVIGAAIGRLDTVETLKIFRGTRVPVGLLNGCGRLMRVKDLTIFESELDSYEWLSGLRDLIGLLVVRSNLTDAGLRNANELHRIEQMFLSGCPIRGEGLSGLQCTESLDRLSLSSTDFDDRSAARLERFQNLSRLGLAGTRLTSAGLHSLSGCSSLKSLDLSQTEVGDSNLVELAELKQLETFYFIDTAISEQGVQELADSMGRRLTKFDPHETTFE